MNYLAHLSLSLDDPYIMMGNFIADEIAVRDIPKLPSRIMNGVRMHRLIDSFTDGHDAFKSSVKLFKGQHGGYAPVIVDIINDHFLSLNWSSYNAISFSQFEYHVYEAFDGLIDQIPSSANSHVAALLNHRYLGVYQSKEGMKGVMKRMDRRTKFNSDFLSAVDHAYQHWEALNENFIQLYSALLDVIATESKTLLKDQPSK